jgi:hypothetical protein
MPRELPVVLTWYGCDLRTGGIVEELPGYALSGPLEHLLGDSSTIEGDLTLTGAPAEWDAATTPGLSMLVAVDQATDAPVWAGIVLPRTGGSDVTVQISAASIEAYFDRRYPGDVGLFATDQADVVTALVTPALTDGPPLVLDAPPIGVTMDYSVADSDDKTILSCLQEVMGTEGGPEWTVDVEWSDSHDGFLLPVRVRAAIGSQDAQPEGTFDFPGVVSSYSLAESYETGKGANDIIGRGDGEGDARITSDRVTADDLIASGWCRYEYRYTPADSITDPAALTADARKSLAFMAQGARVWSITAAASQAPRIGRDWGLGDMIRLAVDHSPRHPHGVDVVARAWGWQLDPGADTVTPILVEDDTS